MTKRFSKWEYVMPLLIKEKLTPVLVRFTWESSEFWLGYKEVGNALKGELETVREKYEK